MTLAGNREIAVNAPVVFDLGRTRYHEVLNEAKRWDWDWTGTGTVKGRHDGSSINIFVLSCRTHSPILQISLISDSSELLQARTDGGGYGQLIGRVNREGIIPSRLLHLNPVLPSRSLVLLPARPANCLRDLLDRDCRASSRTRRKMHVDASCSRRACGAAGAMFPLRLCSPLPYQGHPPFSLVFLFPLPTFFHSSFTHASQCRQSLQ